MIPTITNGSISIGTNPEVVWTGLTDGDWSTGSNWNGFASPEAGDTLIFAGTNNTTNTFDLTDDINFHSITFDNTAGAFTINGIGGVVIDADQAITNDSTNLQTFNIGISSASPMTFDAASGDMVFNDPVAINGTGPLTLTGANDITLNGVVTGATGELVKTGSGTAILTGNNTYGGGTTVSGGVLQGDTGSLQGDITNNAQVVFNQTADGNFGDLISGSGTVIKQGAGTLTLINQSQTYTGATTIEAGALDLNDFSLSGGISIDAGATLQGAGTLGDGDDNLEAAGTVDVGNSIGVLNVNGDAEFASTSTLAVEVEAVTLNADLLDVTGSTLFNNGATIQISQFGAGSFSDSDVFTIASADSGFGATNLNQLVVDSLVSGINFNLQFANMNTELQLIPVLGLTWNGATNNNWSVDGNWDGGTAPVAGENLIFTGNGNAPTNNDYTPGTALGSVTFDSSSASNSIGGNNLTLGSDTAITNQAAGTTQTFNIGITSTDDFAFLANAGELAFNNAVTISNGGTLTIGGAQDTTINSVIDEAGGNGSLTKQGSGTLELLQNNTYSGTTTISDGVLQVGNGGTTGSLGTGSVTNDAGLVFNRSDNTTVSNNITGEGSLTQDGTGELTLDGNNTYDGGTTLNSGTLIVGSDNALGIGDLTINDGVLANDNADRTLANNVIANTSFSVLSQAGTKIQVQNLGLNAAGITITGSQSGTFDINGILSGNDGVSFATVGPALTTFELTGSDANTLAGTVTVNDETELVLLKDDNVTAIADDLTLVGFSAVGIGSDEQIADSATVTLGSDAQLGLGDSVTETIGDLQGSGSIDLVDAGTGAQLILNSGNFAGTITGGNATQTSLTKAEAGTLTLSGASTYAGLTEVQAGRLLANNVAGSATGTSTVTVNSGATLGGDGIIGGPTTVNNGGILDPGTSPGTLLFGDNLTLNDTSVLNFELGGATDDLIDVTGDLMLDGILNITDQGSFDVGNYTLFTYGGSLTDNDLTFGPPPGAFSFEIDTTTPNQIDLLVTALTQLFWDGTNTSPNGAIDGGEGIWDATMTNWTNTDGSFNTPWADDSQAVFTATAGIVTIDDGFNPSPTSIDFRSDGYTLAANGTGGLNNTAGLAVNTDTGVNATVSAPINGTGSLTKTGDGRLLLTGNNNYLGTTTLTEGILQVGDGGANGSLGQGDVTNNGSLIFDRSSDHTLDQAISGTGSLTKLGSGQLTLSGDNTYDGMTTISNGTLLVTNTTGSATGNGAVTVNSGATLGGDGTIGGPTTVNNGGILDPGTSPGTLTFGDDLTLNNTSVLNFELGGVTDDLIDVVGDLTLDGTLNVTDLGGFGEGTYTLFNYAGMLTDNTLEVGPPPGAFSLEIDTSNANQVDLMVTALTQLFWDGPNTTPNGAVSGGDGIWDAATTNWTNDAGNVNTAWVDDVEAVFDGSAGVVTIASGFTPEASQIDFRTTGYTLAATGSGALATTADLPINTGPGVAAIVSTPIEGTGSLTKTGDGTLTLAGNNSYDGTTTIAGGTLQVGNGGTSGSFGNGDVTNNASLLFNRSDATTVDNTFLGAGQIEKIGDGTLTLTGDSAAYTGTFTNNLGIVVNNGQWGGDFVNNAGLMGNGDFDNLTNNGVFSPGNSIGMTQVTGDYDENEMLVIEYDPTITDFNLNPGAGFDFVGVTGVADLDGDAEIRVVPTTDGPVAVGTQMQVLVADGGVVDNGFTVVSESLIVGWSKIVNPFDITLEAFALSFTDEAQTNNQYAVAMGLDELRASDQPPGSPSAQLLAQLEVLTPQEFQQAANTLSPQRLANIFRSHRRTVQGSVNVVNHYLASRRIGMPIGGQADASRSMNMMFASENNEPMMFLAQTDEEHREMISKEGYLPGNKYNIWAQGFYLRSDQDSDGPDNVGYSANTGGGIVGADMAVLDNLLVGVSFAFTGTHGTYNNPGGDFDIYGYRFGPYLAWEPIERLAIDFSITGAFSQINSDRNTVAGTASADYNAYDMSVYLGAEYDVIPESEWYVAPLIGFNYIYLHQEGFTETGAGGANLQVDSQDTNSLDMRIGGRFAWVGDLGSGVKIVPEAVVAYRRELMADTNDDITARFVNAGGGFSVTRGPEDENGIEAGAGVTFIIDENFSFYARYDGVFYSDNMNHFASIGFNFGF